MSKAQHTPGPWTATKVQDRSEYLIRGWESAALPLAVVPSDTGSIRGPRGSATTHANAQLIASAPLLLEALIAAEAFMSGFEDDEAQDPPISATLKDIRAAIEAAGLTANDSQVAA